MLDFWFPNELIKEPINWDQLGRDGTEWASKSVPNRMLWSRVWITVGAKIKISNRIYKDLQNFPNNFGIEHFIGSSIIMIEYCIFKFNLLNILMEVLELNKNLKKKEAKKGIYIYIYIYIYICTANI